MNGQPYEWPRVTAVHPEHGAYQMDVHCLRSADGALVLVAFQDTPKQRQVKIVRKAARERGDAIERLDAADITQEVGVRLAAMFHDNPGTHIAVLQVKRPGGDKS